VEDVSYPRARGSSMRARSSGRLCFSRLSRGKTPRIAITWAPCCSWSQRRRPGCAPAVQAWRVPGEEADLSLVELAIGAYRDTAWRDFAGLNVPVVEDFLARFEAIVEVGDEADRGILESMVRHEAAILRWPPWSATASRKVLSTRSSPN